MERERLIQLTNAVYRLTLLFPKKEPLRYKIREKADDFLAKPNGKDLEILNVFFEVAKNQNWVSPSDVLAIQKEYDNLKGELKKASFVKTSEGKGKTNPLVEVQPRPIPLQSISERQEKILAFLKEVGRAQVWQVKEILPDVTKRTLRRDFEHMLNQGLIERIGERNNTFYQIKVKEV